MNQASIKRNSPVDSNSNEMKYLISTVGPILTRGLAEIVERRPNDPIEYLATFLYQHVDRNSTQEQRKDGVKEFEIEKQKQHHVQVKNEDRTSRENIYQARTK